MKACIIDLLILVKPWKLNFSLVQYQFITLSNILHHRNVDKDQTKIFKLLFLESIIYVLLFQNINVQ